MLRQFKYNRIAPFVKMQYPVAASPHQPDTQKQYTNLAQENKKAHIKKDECAKRKNLAKTYKRKKHQRVAKKMPKKNSDILFILGIAAGLATPLMLFCFCKVICETMDWNGPISCHS